MTQKRHPNSRTSPAMRRSFKESPESNRSLARRFGVNPKTIAKWRWSPTVDEAPMGPKYPVSSVLSDADEALIIVYRKFTRLPLDDCLRRLKPMIPKLTRSSLHRCLRRYDVHRLPKNYGQKHPPPERGESRHFTIQVHSLRGKYLYSAISQAMFVFARTGETFDEYKAARFLTALAHIAPVGVQSVATSGHPVFSDSPEAPWEPEHPWRNRHPFLVVCRENHITRHTENPKLSTPALVVNGWGQILRRRRANRRFTPVSLAERRNLRRSDKEREANWRDDEGDVFDDQQLSAEEAADRRQARLAARMEAKASAVAEEKARKPTRRRPERRKRREARLAKIMRHWSTESAKN